MKKVIIITIIIIVLLGGYYMFTNQPAALTTTTNNQSVDTETDLVNLQKENDATDLSVTDTDFAAEVNAAAQ